MADDMRQRLVRAMMSQRPAPQPPMSMPFGGAAVPSGIMGLGNIDLENRPVVHNPDGTISTVRSMSANFGDGEVLMPTVSDDGRLLSNDEAVNLYRQTGQHLGIFDTPENASAYAEALHNAQAKMYRGR
jgi:hypothetical protein